MVGDDAENVDEIFDFDFRESFEFGVEVFDEGRRGGGGAGGFENEVEKLVFQFGFPLWVVGYDSRNDTFRFPLKSFFRSGCFFFTDGFY